MIRVNLSGAGCSPDLVSEEEPQCFQGIVSQEEAGHQDLISEEDFSPGTRNGSH